MLRRYAPYEDLFDVFKDFDNMFHKSFGEPRWMPAAWWNRPQLPARTIDFTPAVECYTKDKMLVLRAELPGVDFKDVDITVMGNQLTLKGEKKTEHKIDEKDYLFREFFNGRFERTFTIPEGIKPEQVKATFSAGVLEVTLPAMGLETTKKIPIELTEGIKKTVKAA